MDTEKNKKSWKVVEIMRKSFLHLKIDYVAVLTPRASECNLNWK
jgi:hypothetical protein